MRQLNYKLLALYSEPKDWRYQLIEWCYRYRWYLLGAAVMLMLLVPSVVLWHNSEQLMLVKRQVMAQQQEYESLTQRLFALQKKHAPDDDEFLDTFFEHHGITLLSKSSRKDTSEVSFEIKSTFARVVKVIELLESQQFYLVNRVSIERLDNEEQEVKMLINVSKLW